MDHTILTYCVGSHLFQIINGTIINVTQALPSLTPFACSMPTNEEAMFKLYLTDTIGPALTENTDTDICFDWEDARCFIRSQEKAAYLVAITPQNSERTYYMECTDSFKNCTAYLPSDNRNIEITSEPNNTESFVLNNFLMMLYAFNGAHHNTLLMHASVIAHNGKGYLFLGKSGTGKSTHTSLWLKNIEDCHLLNDDNPVVHVDSNSKQVTVYGSPWSGKTPCYRNEHMPVGGFVRLEQAPQNEISLENVVRAFAALLPSCSCLKQDKDIYKGIVATVTEVASLAPVFHLKCLPDKEAAELCRRTVSKE